MMDYAVKFSTGMPKREPKRYVATSMFAMLALGLVGCQKPAETSSATPASTAKTTASAIASGEKKTVAITAIVDHPALDAVRQGVIEELAAKGYKEGQNLTITYQSAQGNNGTAGQIAKQFIADKPDAIVAISTPSAQPLVASTKDIPIIFSAVTDPVTAKLVSNMDASGTNVTGASNAIDFEPQLALMKQVYPNVKNIGYIYSPGEVNSSVILKRLKEKVAPMGITVHEAAANNSTEMAMATQGLASKVDLIYTPTDNHVMSAYEAISKAAAATKTPLFSMDTSTVRRGAAVAIGVNYLDLGRETGKIVYQVLQGTSPATIPVYRVKKLDIHVSPKNAAAQGLTLPQAVIDKADKVIE